MNKNLKYLLPVRIVLFILIFFIGSLITNQKLKYISNWWSIVASIVNIITILVLLLITKKMGINYFKFINYKRGVTTKKEIIFITIIILLIGTAGMYISGYICYGVIPYSAPMMIEPILPILAIINFIVLPLTVSFAEDGLYLGCGVNAIKNKYLSIFIPAFFYALQHSFIPCLLDFNFIIYRFLSFLPLTIVLCFYYYKKKNPLPIMIGHSIIELFSVTMILITSINPEIYNIMLGK